MLQKLDLAALAEDIVSPYRPIPLASFAAVEVSLFICQGPRSWHRLVAHDELLLVLEGVITLDGPGGRLVVNEGELVTAPREVAHNAQSGMRSTVVLVQEQKPDEHTNGHRGLPDGGRDHLDKVNVAHDVRAAEPFAWLSVGAVGAHAAFATRVSGTSAPFRRPEGATLFLVYRGVLDYETPDESGSVVGSQMIIVPRDTPVTLRSEHGATVIALARHGTPLPGASTPSVDAGTGPDVDDEPTE